MRDIATPEGTWMDSHLATSIMTGNYPSYIEDANISTITARGEATRIQAIIGIKAEQGTWNSLTADITRNATGNTTYSINQIPEQEIQRLTLVRGLMRAIPWTHIDPPDWNPLEKIRELVDTVRRVLQEVYRAIINTITTVVRAAANIARGMAARIVEGVRMLKAGIMAMAGFIIKFFRDMALLLWELGQWFIGILRKAWDKIMDIFKNQILYWQSWIWTKAQISTIFVIREIMEQVLTLFGVDLMLGNDRPLHISLHLAMGIAAFDINAEIFDTKYYISYLDAELWCIVMGFWVWNQTGVLINISAVLSLGIIVNITVSVPRINNHSARMPRSPSNITLTKKYMSLFWERFRWIFYAGYASFAGCVFSATAILERAWESGAAWAVSLGLLGGALAAHGYMDLYVMPSIADWAINEYDRTGEREAIEAAIYLYRVIRFAMQHLMLTILARWLTPHGPKGTVEFLTGLGLNYLLLDRIYIRLRIPLHGTPEDIWNLGYSILREILKISPEWVSPVVATNAAGFFFVRNDLVESFPTLIILAELWYMASSVSTSVSLLEGCL